MKTKAQERKEIAKALDKEVGIRFADIRKEVLHMTQEEMAEALDRSVAEIRRYEKGDSRIPDELKVLLSKKFEITTDELLVGENGLEVVIERQVDQLSNKRLLFYLTILMSACSKRDLMKELIINLKD